MSTNRTYRFTIAQPDGRPLCTLLVSRDRTNVSPQGSDLKPDTVSTPPAPAKTANGTPVPESEPRMTDPQRRYLFRLLAAQGVDGKAVDGHLRQLLNVTSLREVSKTTASQLIERLIAEQKEGGHAHA